MLQPGDHLTLVGPTNVMSKVLPRFRSGELRPRRIVIMGGSPISVWLTRALAGREFKVRLYVPEHARARELAEKLPHVTVIEADPADPDVFAEEHIAHADAFVAAGINDEHNTVGVLEARHLGSPRTVAVIHQPRYHQLIEGLGIDRVFSPRVVAARGIQRLTQRATVRPIARLDEHGTGVYEIRVGIGAVAVGQTLLQLDLPPGCVLIAVQRGDEVRVPGPRDVIGAGDTLVAITLDDRVRKLNALFS